MITSIHGVKLKMTILKKELFHIHSINPRWIGVAASIEGAEFVDKDQKTKIQKTCFTDCVEFTNGWTVTGTFGSDNMGCGFSSFIAKKKDSDTAVFGDYERGGVFCENEELLKDFLGKFPPYDCD